MITKTGYLLISFILLFVCCSKDDNKVTESNRAQALLGQWGYQSIVSDRAVDLNGDNISNIDLFNTQELRQCLKDNITTYTDHGPSGKPEYNVTENNLACDDNSPFSIVEEDFWTLTDKNSTISFEERDSFRIVDLTKNKLVVESEDVFEGMPYTVTITYKRR